MANYFQGTIRLLQSMIMDERQRAAERESPQYQFAVEKLAAQKRQNLLQQTILQKLASGSSPEEVARIAGDYPTLLKVPLQRAQTGAYDALTGQRQQSAELSKERMETEEKRQIRQGTLADLDKARIKELNKRTSGGNRYITAKERDISRILEKEKKNEPLTPTEKKRIDSYFKTNEEKSVFSLRMDAMGLYPDDEQAQQQYVEQKLQEQAASGVDENVSKQFKTLMEELLKE